MTQYTPIALFVYNRPEHTKRTVEALQKNNLAQQSDLFVFSDGPKETETGDVVYQTREYVKTIIGFKSVTIIESGINKGLANSIISGVTDIVNRFGKVIVLEDDLITSPYFLKYMNDGLDLYEKEEKVISIHGYVYPAKGILPETFFLKNPGCWGWATWKRGWSLFQPDGKKLLDELEQKNLRKEFNFDDNYHYSKMLKNQIEGRNNSWAVRWYASAFLSNKLTLYPGTSLVNNFGFDGSGVHSSTTSVYTAPLARTPIHVHKIEIQENSFARKKITEYFRSLKPNILRRLYSKAKSLLPAKTKVWILHIVPNVRKYAKIIIGRTEGTHFVRPNPNLPNYYIFRNTFANGSTIIDVGCGFDADFSVYMIEKYGLKSIGIDPTLKHKDALAKISQNMGGKFRHILAAISSHDGKISFNESLKNISGSILQSHTNVQDGMIRKYEVDSVSLKKLPEYVGLKKIEYIKLDIEGAEYDLIRQLRAEDVVAYDQLFIEFHHHATNYSQKDTVDCVKKMKSLGFENFTLDNHDFLFYRT